jgi:pimeloyl-ACP methyl ester carboxylesterase
MMRRRDFVAIAAAAGTTLMGQAGVFAQGDATPATPMMDTTPQSGYAPVNGLQMYYEIHGGTPPSSGGGLGGEVPLLLLHGAFGAIDLWGPILTALAAHHQVIAVEFQGHGHTADIIDRPLGYQQLADDVAAVMAHLGIAHADVVGYSMGGTTGLQVAIRHPRRVRTLVAVSPNYRADGYYPELLAGLQVMTPEIFVGTPEEAAYLRHAPHPENFPLLVEKQQVLPQAFAFPEDDVATIAAPAQLIYGDSDVVRPEHAVALFRLLGGGVPSDLTGSLPSSQLAILPGTTHRSIVGDRADQLLAVIEPFLAAPVPDGA